MWGNVPTRLATTKNALYLLKVGNRMVDDIGNPPNNNSSSELLTCNGYREIHRFMEISFVDACFHGV